MNDRYNDEQAKPEATLLPPLPLKSKAVFENGVFLSHEDMRYLAQVIALCASREGEDIIGLLLKIGKGGDGNAANWETFIEGWLK